MLERTPAELAILQLRQTRIIAAAFLGWAGMIVYMAERILRPPVKDVDGLLFTVLSVVATVQAAAALVVRLKAVPAVRRNIFRGDITARMQWNFSYMGGLALSEAVLLFGFVLRFLGAATSQVLPFYIGGVVLMALFFPQSLEAPVDPYHP